MTEQQQSQASKKRNKYIIIGAVVVILIIIAIIAGATGGDSENGTETTTSEETNQEETAKETAEEETTEELAEVDFSGAITPSVALVGEKVVVEVTVENLDTSKVVDGLRLVFSGELFEEALVVTGVMNGGIQESDSAFEWDMAVPPGETITYTIVGTANEPGNYEGTVILKPPSEATVDTYVGQGGTEQLGYSLAVTP